MILFDFRGGLSTIILTFSSEKFMNYELFNHQDKKIYLINMLREENQIFSELFEKGVEKYLRAGKKI